MEDDVRLRLLKSAVEELNEITAAALLRGIGVRAIAKRAGTSPTTFFREFGTVEEFATALIDWVYNSERPGWTGPELRPPVDDIRRSLLPTEQTQHFHRSEFDRLYTDPEQRLRSTLWAYTGEYGAAAYGRFLRRLCENFAPPVAATFDSWGRELVAPITPEAYVSLQTSLIVGVVATYRVEPDLVSPELFSLVGAALAFVLLRLKGETHSLPSRLTEMNYYPLDAKVGRPLSARAQASRNLILHAAADLFHSDGYDHVTVGQIARRADVSVSTLYAHFPGKSQLAAALFRAQAAGVLATYLDPPTDLTEHLTRVAQLTMLRQQHAAHYLAELAVPSGRTEPDPLLETANVLLGDLEQAELAVLLTLRKVLADPSADPAQIAGSVSRVIGELTRDPRGL